MFKQYRHGGGYKQAANLEGINWKEVTDYSTSINWMATKFYPEDLIYLHQENIEYPDPNYNDLRELIEEVHGFKQKHFLLNHGANEAIYNLFNMFSLRNYQEKKVILVGPTYNEYNKYCDLYGFASEKIGFKDFKERMNDFKSSIIIIVNPNTPLGVHHSIQGEVQHLLHLGSIIVVDESFIDFTEKKSLYNLVDSYPNLYIIHSMTKFYGSAGARLGLIISSNKAIQTYLSDLLPPWIISAYDNWFYKFMIPKYKEIKAATIDWIKETNHKANEVLNDLNNISNYTESITSYRTLMINPDVIDKDYEEDIRKFFLKKYKIFIRPTNDFFRCPKSSFRVGLRLPEENELLWNAIKDIG